MRFLGRFVAFWYDFLVGDRWELFLGPIAVLIVVGLIVAAGVPALITAVAFVALVAAIAAVSIGWAVR